MRIRPATLLDRDAVLDLYLAAFPEAERETVAAVAVDLLSESSTPESFALVAEADGAPVGHISFSPVSCGDADNFVGVVLAPLAVHPKFQKQGIGARLVEAGMQRLSELGVGIVFVYGDPSYYGRFGFDADIAARYVPPYPLQYPFGWQAKALTDVGRSPSSGKLTCVAALQDPQLW